ncbi:IS3 family transposase [Oceanirhabdus seepicola]|uniref:IS3 family transposase n=1 Tax=Oceanirhabdus seepicola TaxID=2828781 RepID=A0A9J6P8L6_9CLOT|nr:IS3 family transposase [Oceanirhabdus seepicola]
MAKYTMEFKLEVVKYFKENGKAETVKKYNISNTAIYKWEHLYDTYGIEGFKRKTVKKYTVEEKLNIIQSMSRKGNCLDNSLAENFFSHLKSEFYYLESFDTIDDFIRGLDEYIQYYNTERISSKLKGMTPVQYRNHSIAA